MKKYIFERMRFSKKYMIKSSKKYYAFGWQLPNRHFNTGQKYRFAFNGQEKDQDLAGGHGIIFKYRVHDPRLGRFYSFDPLAADYPWNSEG